MQIKGFIETSLSDYNGKVASVIFLPGCNLRCGYCFNADLVLKPEQLPTIPLEKIKEYVKENRNFVDAIVITGGEPTQHEELPALLKELKELGVLVKLDTNGTKPKLIKELIEKKLVDYIAMDIKAPFEKYDKATGVKTNIQDIKESIKTIKNSGIDHEFRSTILPRLHRKKDAVEMAKNIKGAKRLILQGFRPEPGKLIDKSLEKEKPYSEKEMQKIAEECNKHVKTAVR